MLQRNPVLKFYFKFTSIRKSNLFFYNFILIFIPNSQNEFKNVTLSKFYFIKLQILEGTRAIILYTYDVALSGSEVLTMELSSSQFMEAVKTSKLISSTEAEPLKLDSGYFSLLEGKDTTFKLTRFESEVKCQCKAIPKPKTTTLRPTTTTTSVYFYIL